MKVRVPRAQLTSGRFLRNSAAQCRRSLPPRGYFVPSRLYRRVRKSRVIPRICVNLCNLWTIFRMSEQI
jgi:hypothetical protein